MNTLDIKQLNKSFGNKHVLRDLSLSIPKGSIYGFVGENGAGKTTTLSTIVGLLKADSGQILVNKETVQYGKSPSYQKIGYLPDVPEFYPYMTAKEYLFLCGKISQLDKDTIHKNIDETLRLVSLNEEKQKIGGYSRGMKQRLGLAQALLHKPEILICDEPTSALDPVGRKKVLEIFKKIKGNTTILFSTHILSDVEKICDSIGILHNGKLQAYGSLHELKEKYSKKSVEILFQTSADCRKFIENFSSDKDYGTITNKELTVLIETDKKEEIGQDILEQLTRQKITPAEYKLLDTSLEDIFLEVIK